MALTPEEVQELERLKEKEFSDDRQPGVPEGYRLVRDGVDDESFDIDPWGRATIGDIPVTSSDRMWDEETGDLKSPAELQAELGEEPQWEEEPDLPPAYAEPCPTCEHVTDLRDRTKAGITGVKHVDRIPCLSWRCKCGEDRVTDGRQLPPDLAEAGDEMDELMDYLAEECIRAQAHKPW